MAASKHIHVKRATDVPRPTVEVANLVGIIDMSDRCGVAITTIWNWTKRYDDFPAPIAHVSRVPVWDWSDVSAWCRAREKSYT